MALDKGTCLRFYKRKDLQEAIIEHARNKEVGVRYGDAFGKRPDILAYRREVIELAKQGVTSFHASEELWTNPLMLQGELSRKELDELRMGWDLVLDIDCKFLEYSKIAADLIIRFLKHNKVKDYSVKFSGNKGFHIGIPFEAFPQQIGIIPTKNMFPEAPKKIAVYIKENIKEELGKRILEYEKNDFLKVKEKVGLEREEIIRYEKDDMGSTVAKLEVEKFLGIDTILLASRHLYRMPYSLHEKSGLVSLPIDPKKVMDFERNMAHPQAVLAPMFSFLSRNVNEESARQLLVQALDFEIKTEEPTEKSKDFEEIEINCPITEELFPPCIKKMTAGLNDGRKRGIFIMINFLGKIGWSKKEIESFIRKWNQEKNPEPLREVYIKGQINHSQPGDRLPPNCSNDAYYRGMGICSPDNFCRRIKNPVNYTIFKWKASLENKE